MPAQQRAQQAAAVRAAYEEASGAFRAGRVEAAESLCRDALTDHPEEPNLLCLLGEIALRRRRPAEAEDCYGRVLAYMEAYPRALEGMGLALLADGRAEQAVAYLQRAADAAPQRSATRFALARALAEAGEHTESKQAVRDGFELNPSKAALARAEEAQLQGRLEDAEKILRQELGRDPDNPRALRMLGTLALEANRFGAARRLLEKAVELDPGFVMGWNDLANFHMKQDRYDEALELVDKAIALDPVMAHSFVMRGNVLNKAQRHEEALQAYDQALGINPMNPGALSGKGHVLKTIGRQQESIDAYRRCIRAHPHFGEAYWSLANLKTFRFEPEEVEVMENMVGETELADEARVNFYLSLGKHYENCGDYDRAFENYRAGNELRRGHEIYDPVQTQVVHDRIIEVFSREFLEAREGWGDPDPAPILIVGLPRSGSTLIEQILASHSRVEGTMELPDLARTIGELSRRSPGRSEYPEATRDMDPASARALGQHYIRATRRYRTDKPYFIDKMPNNFPSVGFLHLILPNAKIIDARRHPLDSCLGSYKQLFFKGQSFTYDQFELGHYYLQYRRMMDHWAEVLPGKVLEVNYEEMVVDQEGQTRRILDHCGLPWEDQCLRFYETERAINTASSEQVRQPIYTGAVHFWRNYERHLGELIETLEPLLRELPPEDRPASLQS